MSQHLMHSQNPENLPARVGSNILLFAIVLYLLLWITFEASKAGFQKI